ncbi:MAG: hypothetical protein KC613_20265 [Myxococcales bacterium]|nr:hypothetical protein [Myxococcales bacterium]MCB9523319.1 hypothetical protein [Myxococcales bacterium]
MQLRELTLALAVLGAVGIVGCDDGGGGGTVREDAGMIGPGGSGGGGGAGGGGGGETEEVLRLTYTKQAGQNTDLVVYDFADNAELNLTAGVGIDCGQGCVLNADMTWIAWRGGEGDATDDTLKVAPVDVVRKEIRVDRTRVVADDVRRFEFTGDLIVYATGQPQGTDRTIEVLAEPIAGCADANCPQFVGNIGANGGFRVADVGQTIVVLDISLSAMTVNLYNAANGLSSTIHTFGSQGGTGSPFSGRQPVGMSPDQSYLVAFTPEDFLWRVNTLELRPNPPEPVSRELFEAEMNPNAAPCQRDMPYNFTEVQFNPVFSTDSAYMYFVAAGDCSGANRTDTDVLRLPRDVSGATAENITNNPRVSHWSNQEIRGFDLSPEGDRLAYISPRITDANSQAIWVINPDDGAFDCGRNEGQPDLDGIQRCPFIFDDGQAGVRYRDVRFVTVQVPR